MEQVQYQYWIHKKSGETYAVAIIAGKPEWVNGPLYYKDVAAYAPSEYNFDDRWEDDPADYRLKE